MRRWTALLLLAVGGVAAAEGSDSLTNLQRSFEMPAHRSLQNTIRDGENALIPFETDGCSGGMSWSWQLAADLFPGFEASQGQRPPWENCCVTHDIAYHNAGGAADAESSFDARLAADTALEQCVRAQGASDAKSLAGLYSVSEDQILRAYDLISQSMYNAVRLGGGPCSGLPWRWGFGYKGCVPGL
ncbi:MAG: hypothetical protein AAF665_04070 [Pseudomonadota bacterium]